MVEALQGYRHIATMWMRSSLAYPTSFWMLTTGAAVVGCLDFVGIWIMFHTIDSLGGFSLPEIGFLYGAAGFGLAVGDLVAGQVQRLGQLVRVGRLDTMMVRPVPLIAQVCAEEFAPRRVSRVLVTSGVFAWGASYVDWTPAKVLVSLLMLLSGATIFASLFVLFSCLQFWTHDSAEVASAFTYGGSTASQYPLAIFPSEVVKALTFAMPLAFVNWYPSLYILDREDPFGMPEILQFASPVAAAILVAVTALAWRTSVRHYTSTGS